MTALKRTPLHDAHRRLSARMVEFAGFSMPVQYTSIVEEHRAVREAAGLFDTSHMGQLHLEGEGALAATDRLLTRPASPLAEGRVLYALLCNEEGGVVDDVTCYRTGDDALFLCVNAANREKDYRWVVRHGPAGGVRDASDETAMLAVQGPASPAVLARVADPALGALRRYRFARAQVAGRPALVSRTGYTGEDGFELYLASADAEPVFEALLAEGKPLGLVPAGLGARDTLRLEAALPLYGHELDDETSPLEAGLARFVDLDGHDFLGAAALARRRDAGPARRLVGFEVVGRGIARAGHPVHCDGQPVGVVTSGAPSPTLGKAIGLAYVSPERAATGTQLDVIVRGRAVPARVVDTPFVRAR